MGSRYSPLLGKEAVLTGISLQTSWASVHTDTLRWITASASHSRSITPLPFSSNRRNIWIQDAFCPQHIGCRGVPTKIRLSQIQN